ncbi:MAG: hypothetical protein ACOH10_15050 [Rhodoglobus sp.]
MDGTTGESMPVQLTRMEGKFDNLAMQVGYLVPRVDHHETEIGDLKLTVQRLDLDATARDKTVIATAAALKDAKDAQEATARSEAAKKEQSWSPAAKIIAALGSVAVLWSLLQAVVPV